MRIVQTVFGVFHHFELARELERRGHLEQIYSTWPGKRLAREGLPTTRVASFPWLHMPEYLLARSPLDLPWAEDHLGYANALAFDRWTERQLRARLRQPPGLHLDALIGISGSSLRAGCFVQDGGGRFICDRGSTHQRFQERLVAEEYRRWSVDRRPSDDRDTRREDAIYAACDAITVPSIFAASSFAAMGVDPAKLHVIPYGVRLENFTPARDPDGRLAPPAPAGEFNVLFAGAVGLRKGVPYLLRAFAALRHPRKRLRLAGPLQADLRSLLPTLPLDNVELLGPLPQPELAAVMRRSHVLALPSIEEGLALVQAQAMACGCPVLCSTNTGGADLFTDGVEGFVVPIRDADSLCDRLQQLANDPALQARFRLAALERVRSIGGWHDYGDRWEQLLRQLTGSTEGTGEPHVVVPGAAAAAALAG